MKLLSLVLPGGQVINQTSLPNGGLAYASSVIQNAVTLLLIFAVVVTLIFLIWGGIQWLSSSGDKVKLTAARGRLTWAIIGLIICLLTFAIVNVVASFFSVKLLG